jgi:hypothetical protein
LRVGKRERENKPAFDHLTHKAPWSTFLLAKA